MDFPGKGFQSRCVLLVAKVECQCAEEVIAEVNREFYPSWVLH